MRVYHLLAISYPKIQSPDDLKWYRCKVTFLITKDLDNDPDVAHYMRANCVESRQVDIEIKKPNLALESIIAGQKYPFIFDVKANNGFGEWTFLEAVN